MNDYNIVKENIEKSHIKRFNYKSIIGESLTSFVTKMKMAGQDSAQIKQTIMELPSVQNFLMLNAGQRKDFEKNINISVSARCAEQNSLERLKDGN